jgi:O-antigen/teichoic acid export membrane protein
VSCFEAVNETSNAGRAAYISKAFVRSVRDNTIAEFAAQAIRFAGIVVLARALTPSDFGILKALFAIAAIASLLLQGGIPHALVQRRELGPEHECTGWWMSLAVTLMTVAVMFVTAGWIADWMGMPDLRFGIRLMCVPILLDGTSTVSNARLQRELRFGALALADVLAEVAFLAAAFALLAVHLRQWSLIGGLAARFAAHGICVWIADARFPMGLPRMSAARDLGRFALSVWGGRIVQAASDSSDSLLIGAWLGSGPLGIYGMARDLLRFVPKRLHKVAGRVTLSAFSRLQDDDKALAHAYSRFFNSIARVVLPAMVCMAVTAPDLVTTIYGEKWLATAQPLQILSFGLIFVSMMVAISSIYFAKNYPSFDIHLNGLRLVLIVGSVYALRHAGLIGVVAGISASEAITSIAAQYVGCKFTGLTARDLFVEALPGLKLAVACGVVSAAGELIAHFFGIRGVLALLIAGVPAGAVYGHMESANLLRMLRQAFSRERGGSKTAEQFSQT